ncbi:uncharacterized protein FN964_010295 [Alca torda]
MLTYDYNTLAGGCALTAQSSPCPGLGPAVPPSTGGHPRGCLGEAAGRRPEGSGLPPAVYKRRAQNRPRRWQRPPWRQGHLHPSQSQPPPPPPPHTCSPWRRGAGRGTGTHLPPRQTALRRRGLATRHRPHRGHGWGTARATTSPTRTTATSHSPAARHTVPPPPPAAAFKSAPPSGPPTSRESSSGPAPAGDAAGRHYGNGRSGGRGAGGVFSACVVAARWRLLGILLLLPPSQQLLRWRVGDSGQRCPLGIFPFLLSNSQQGLVFFSDNLGDLELGNVYSSPDVKAGSSLSHADLLIPGSHSSSAVFYPMVLSSIVSRSHGVYGKLLAMQSLGWCLTSVATKNL